MAQILPLFPLSVVLLPATPLPLHIFEDRYKQMMADVTATGDEFGIVLAKDEGIINVGCSARIERVLKQYSDGRLDLIAVGQRRFRIQNVDEEKPYLRAQVEFFEDVDDAKPDDALKGRAIAACDKLRAVESPNIIAEPALDGPRLSFQLGQFIADVDKRQALLTMESEVERLKFLLSVLPEYTVERQQVTLAKRVAPLNGHAKHVKDLGA